MAAPKAPHDKNITVEWDGAHRYSPAPRHRRRLLLRLLKQLPAKTFLDVGCAQPYLLEQLARLGKQVAGCDLSDQVVRSNRQDHPDLSFKELDICRGPYPLGKRFDVVIASEVLEHIRSWPRAVANLCRSSRGYVVITVPCGPIYPIDRRVGHTQHFQGPELEQELRRHGFEPLLRRTWGFPFHSLYKDLINRFAPERLYRQYGAGRYGLGQKLVANLLYGVFFVNDLFRNGQQLFLIARQTAPGPKGA